MALKYSDIPSAEVVVSDGNLALITTKPSTARLQIIGPAVDGPTELVVSARNVSDLTSLYGPIVFDASNYVRPSGVTTNTVYNGNALLKGFNEAAVGGAGDVYLLRVGGTKASGTHTGASPLTGTILYESVYGGRIYNQTQVTFVSGASSGSVTITQANAKGGAFTITYSGSSSGLTVKDLIDKVNSDVRNKSVILSLGTMASSGAARNLDGSTTLTGGLDGTQYDDSSYRENLYGAIVNSGGAFDMLEDTGDPAAVVTISGIYADDQVTADGSGAKTTTSIATAFTTYLAKRSQDYPQIGVLGIRPLGDFSTRAKVATHASNLTSTTAGSRGSASDRYIKFGYFLANGFRFTDAQREMDIDAGGFLQTTAGDVVFSDSALGNYIESMNCFYAGLLSRINASVSPTNFAIGDVLTAPYLFARSDVQAMLVGLGADPVAGTVGGGGYVTLRQDGGVLRIVRGITSAKRSSDFREVQTLRIVQSIQRAIRQVAGNYLGKPNTLVVKQSLETQVKSILQAAADEGSIIGGEGIGYSVNIVGGSDSTNNLLLGLVSINANIIPALEIRQITINVKASLAL